MKDFNFGRPHPKKMRSETKPTMTPRKMRETSEKKDALALQRQMRGSSK